MKKIAIVLGCLAVAGTALAADVKVDNGPVSILGGALDCTGATEMTCGETAGGAVGDGAGNVATYGCTTLGYDGSEEAVYKVCVGATTDLTVTMNYLHSATNDLDLFVLGSCNEADCLGFEAATSGVEVVSLPGVAAGDYYVVVDGWNGSGSDGSGHDVSVDCDAPCVVSVEETTWGEVKSLYNQ